MRKIKLLLPAVCVIISAACLLNGCSASNSGAGAENTAGKESAAVQEGAAGTEKTAGKESTADAEPQGMIVGIDTENKTVSIANMGFGPMPGGNNGQQPEKPSGEASGKDGQQPPQMPGGNNGQQPEKPSGEASGKDGQQPPQMPGGNNGQPPEKPSGEASGKDGEQPPQMPEGGAAGESTVFSVTDATVITDKDGNKISLSDLQANSFVTYTADNGTLLTLSVQAMEPMPGGGMGEKTGEAPSK